MPKLTIKEILMKIVNYSPTAAPYVGNIYAQFLADAAIDDLKSLLNEIKTISKEERQSLNTTNSELIKMQEAVNELIGTKSKKTRMTVLIPAGGEGGSLFPVTQVMPKCLVTIGNKSMLQHIIDPFYHQQDLFDKTIVMTDKYSDAVNENIKQGNYGNFVECAQISGKTLPDALLKLKDSLPEKPFVIHYNDVLIEECDWNHIYDRYFEYKKRNKHIGMLLCSNYYPSPLGIGVIKEGKPDTLSSFIEKPEQLSGRDLANLAIAIFEPEIFRYMESGHSGLFENTISNVIQSKRTLSLYRIEKWHHVQDLKALYYLQNNADLSFLTNRFKRIR